MAHIARDLNISPARLEGMVQYWVRKGKLREVTSFSNCGTCGHGANGCPYMTALPKCYELAVENEAYSIPLSSAGVTCRYQK
jgi:FeoC like transcriptional regulator